MSRVSRVGRVGRVRVEVSVRVTNDLEKHGSNSCALDLELARLLGPSHMGETCVFILRVRVRVRDGVGVR